MALYNASGALVDFVAMGDKSVGVLGGAGATPFSWPSGFSANTQSVTRTGTKGRCPCFLGSDWSAKTSSKPTPQPRPAANHPK